MRHRVIVVAALAAGGCVAPVSPRVAAVAPRGRFSAEASLHLASYAPGTAATDEGGTERGNAAQAVQASAPLLVLGGFLLQAGLDVRYGLGHGCEAGGMLRALRLAAEGRCQLVDEDDGAPLSLSVASAVGYTPFYDRGGVWGRAGIDVSRRVGRRGAKGLLLDVYTSYGREASSVALDVAAQNEDSLQPPFAAMVRREVRLAAALGWTWRERDEDGVPTDGMVVIAVVPYRTLWHGDPDRLACEGCASATVTGVETDLGIALILSLNRVPRRSPATVGRKVRR